VKTLLSKGADITNLTNNHWTALHYAAKNGHCDVINELLNSNANINAKDINGKTPLYNRHTDAVKML